MDVYLPIAEVSVNLWVILAMGAGVGFLSGMFGVGGGFLMTPLLIFYGIPPAVAVATEANQITASSTTGAISHWRRRALDMKMGYVLLIGGIAGSVVGVQLFALLKALGQIELIISLSYVTLLGAIGTLMLFESVRAIRTGGELAPVRRRPSGRRSWMQRLPFKMRFRRSKLYISAIPPIGLGFIVGLLAAMLGIGGGFIMVPAMIYLLRMPTNVVIGTSLFQIIFVTALVTVLHAVTTQTVDFFLAAMLILGGVAGAQVGARVGTRLRGEQLRLLLALLVLGVGVKLGLDLVITPSNPYSTVIGEVME